MTASKPAPRRPTPPEGRTARAAALRSRGAVPLIALAALLALPACVADPRLNAGVSLGTGGVHVYPSVSGRVGGARISVSP